MYAGTLSYFAQLQAQYELSTLASKANISPMFQRDPTNPTQAVSTVKALQLANQQGQQIYKIDNTNIDTVLPKLNLSNSIKQDIQSSVNVGKYVITHTDNVSVPGWSGAGYAIIDPLTGSDAYMISGGENGGFLIWAGSTLMIIAAIGFVFSAPVSALIIGAMAVIGALLFSSGIALLAGEPSLCALLVAAAYGVALTLISELITISVLAKISIIGMVLGALGDIVNGSMANNTCGTW